MNSHQAESMVSRVIDAHLGIHPDISRRVMSDPEFHRDVKVLANTLEMVCDAAKVSGVSYSSAMRMLELTVSNLVKLPPVPAVVAVQPETPQAGQIFLSILDQGETWIDASGFMWKITGMEPRHCRNVINMLHRRADELAFAAGLGMLSGIQPSGDVAQDCFDRELEELQSDPSRWLDGTELIKALRRRMEES